MIKPSKGAAIFLAFFGAMFLVPGLLALITFLGNGRNTTASGTIGAAAIALFISAVGAGFLFAAFAGYSRLKKLAATEEANPTSPWLWRADWANSRANSSNKKGEITAWVVSILFNLVIIPVVATAAPPLIRNNDPRAFLVLAFSLLGIIPVAIALRSTLRHRRFGDTYFEFDTLPFSTGGRLSGRIHLKMDSDASHGVDLRLSCIRRTVTGSGNSRTTAQTVLWQTEQNVSSGALGMDPFGRTIPVDFAVPSDAYVSDQENSLDQVVWTLHAQADVPGIDYSDDFEVPVFRTSSSTSAARVDSSSANFGITSAALPSSPSFVTADGSQIAAPAHTKVVITSQDGCTEFYFPAFRSPAHAIVILVFTAIWSGVVYFIFRSGAPWVFASVFGFFDVLLVFGVLHTVLGTARIRAGNGEVVSTKRVLGIGSSKRFPASEIDTILPITCGGQGNNQGGTTYAIRLRTKNGKRITLADEIDSRQEARWIVSQIESLAGLKIDTHVEPDLRFGPPPQPGQVISTSGQSPAIRLAFQQSKPQSRAATAMSLGVFVLLTVGMFAWQATRFANLKSASAASRANRARNARTAAVRAPRHFAVPMTDADAERVLALPAQDQAEELLERAIGHDQRALELFDQHVEEWVGHIHMTDHMRQLERRSEYSSDLRVRFANVDINLTLDGWQKNEQAADMLIERAKTDQKYRAAAVYFLGMLAGRGVAYDKIHPVLLDYARNNSDAYVRQWAVEGMRYLGKDETLDELFDSFTHDPSTQVRNRAGCNLSDCGNFTRAQRMRIVPKFIDLISDASTNPQMKGWSYLALQEITSAAVPSDPVSWKNWYRDHGTEKLAEFKALDWWQVRGDE
ncbi:MAG: HEAT repeat domain-containing protein [Candidatus Acidiferrum sp.]